MSSASSLAQLVQAAAASFQRHDFADAERQAREVIDRFGEEANALMILGLVRLEAGDVSGAVAFLSRARRKNPSHIHVLNNLGTALKQQSLLAEARHVLEEAVGIDGTFAPAHNNLGNVLLDLGLRTEARHCYERAVALQPDYADATANLARLAEQEHRLDDAAALAARALAAGPGHLQARLTQARVRLRQGQVSEAVVALEGLLGGSKLPVNLRIVTLGYLGEGQERLGHYSTAFNAFRDANDLQLNLHAEALEAHQGYLSPKRVEQLLDFCRTAPFATWRPAPPAALSPVFLVGFPRSGTTLLDQILSSHPGVTTLEEQDTLLEVCKALMPMQGAFGFWADLPDHEIERLRALYWHGVHAALGGAPAAPVFIDKLPLNAVLLPLIYRLFPAAKVILALRDPRDAVLSCFQQRFVMNEAMYPLLRLGTAVGYYDRVMSLVQVCRARLPLPVHAVRYEDVVADFDAQIGGVLNFLGLAFDPRVRNFQDTARGRMVNTPSAAQVVQPLYSTSVGKWRHYAAQMAESLPALAPWVAAFGYEP